MIEKCRLCWADLVWFQLTGLVAALGPELGCQASGLLLQNVLRALRCVKHS